MEPDISPIEPDAPDAGYGSEHRRASRLHDWRLKAAIQTVLSAVPWGPSLNYLLQRHITRTLPISDSELRGQVAKAQRNLVALQRHGAARIADAHLYEFGVGWDLLIPLVHYAMGVERQTVVDIRPLARADLVRHTANRLGQAAERLALRRPPVLKADADDVRELVRPMGIVYRAPADARSVDLPDASVDLATSCDVIEHIPLSDLPAILGECRRLLAPGGLLHVRVDYQDHYWYFDAAVSPYNFLRYSEPRWRRVNPGLHYQSRIRHPQLLEMAESAGFTVVEDQHPVPSNDDLAQLSRVPPAAEFRHLAPEELAIRYASLTLSPRP